MSVTNGCVPRLRTPGVIADRLQVALRTRPHIRPAARAGRLRLYDREGVAMIRHELNAIEARKGGSDV